MSNSLRLCVFLISFLLFIVCFVVFRRGRMPLKYLLIWWFPAAIILLVALIPSFLESLTRLLGFQTISNMIVGLLFVVLIFISISLTIIISGQQTKIIMLIQEVSMLKRKIDIIEGENQNHE